MNLNSTWNTTLADDAATTRVGALLAQAIEAEREGIARQGLVLALEGTLGAGKTTLLRGLLRAAGVQGPIKSPTFAVLEPYVVSNLNFYHFDFYRFSDAAEFSDIGFRELFGAGNICAMEWPERVAQRLPPADLRLRLSIVDVGRVLEIEARSELGISCLHLIRTRL